MKRITNNGEDLVDPTVGEALRTRRTEQEWSLGKLAKETHYSIGHLSNVENATKPATLKLAKACDDALGTGGELEKLVGAGRRPSAHCQSSTPSQLPAAPRFTGRRPLLSKLGAALAEHQETSATRIIAIDGTAGVGKTTIAAAWARSIRHRFPDGVLFSDLRGHSPEASPMEPGDVLEGFLRTLGIAPADIPTQVEQRSALFRTVLDGTRTLIVLDNAASSAQVRPLLPGTTDCLTVITSRIRLSGLAVREGAHRIVVEPFTQNESLELLRDLVGADRVTAERDAALELARLCSHIPLAICVAAERIAAYPEHTLSDLVVDLTAETYRLDLLTSGDDHTLAVRMVFSWSYQALHVELARLFRLLGLHRGPLISVDAAAALAGIDHARAYRLLDELCVAHLIERSDNDHYRLHDLLRLYAAELTNTIDSNEERLRAVSSLVRWYLHTVDSACRALTPNRPHIAPEITANSMTPLSFATYSDALDWCDVHVQNIAFICKLAMDFSLFAEGWQLPVALLDYLLIRNPWSVWMSTHVIGLVSAIRCDDAFGQGWVLTNLGEAYRRQGDLSVAQDHFDRALILSRDHSGRIGQAWALGGLAFVALDRGETDVATGHLNEMITLCRDRDYPFGEATALAALSEAERLADHPEQALEHARTSLLIFERLNDTPGRAYALVRMGRALLTQGELLPAGACLARAIELHHQAGDAWAAADALVEHGHLLFGTGHAQEGLSCWHAALKDFEGIDQRRAAELRHRIGLLS